MYCIVLFNVLSLPRYTNNLHMEKADSTIAQMRKGALEMCVVAAISSREAYASDILDRLKNSHLIVVEGTLYPILTRLKNEGFLSYRWEESNSGPPRKYFVRPPPQRPLSWPYPYPYPAASPSSPRCPLSWRCHPR